MTIMGGRLQMVFLILSIACAGLFSGAALYVNLVEHPARMSCGPELALREFAPSYQRAAVMQACLAIGGLALGLTAAWRLHDSWVAVGAVLLGASVPFTLIVVLPTNKQLLDPTLDSRSPRVTSLFRRWNRLHAIRSLLSAAAFGVLLCRTGMR
jgi:hypothetical protein